MREKERSEDDATIDPPDNQGGTSKDTKDAPDESGPMDPPSNSGNTTMSDL